MTGPDTVVEYNDTQCDKRNTYRRKVKEEKATATTTTTTQDGDSEAPKEADGTETSTNGTTTNGHIATEGDDERPAKKLKGDGGEAVGLEPDDAMSEADDDGPEDLDEESEVMNDGDELESLADGDQDADEGDGPEETMEDSIEVIGRRGELRDEALDEPDSD